MQKKNWAIDSFECLYHVYWSGSAHVFALQVMKYKRWWEMLRSSIWNEAKSRWWWNSAEVWGWGGHNGQTVWTKEGRGSGHDVHAAICLKEGGSISNFRSKEGQLKHGEVIIYCSSTRVMKDSSRIREAFTSAVLLIACTREAQRSFITPLLQLWRFLRQLFPDVSSLEFLQKCGKVFQEVFCIFPRFFFSLICSDQH